MKRFILFFMVLSVICAYGQEGTQDNQLYDLPDQSAEFSGDLYTWLSRNINYPAECQEQGIQGRVFVQFVIEKDGSITDATVLRSPDEKLAAEALRIVNSMPKWKPAMNGGNVVRMRYNLPISFRLIEDPSALTVNNSFSSSNTVASIHSSSNPSTTALETPSINQQTTTSTVRDIFQQAYNLPSSQVAEKAELYVKVINDDPYNREGLHSQCYNNIAVLYEGEGNLKKAKEYYEKAVQIDPSNTVASNNLKRVKQERRNERWNKVGAVLGAIGNSLEVTTGMPVGSSIGNSLGNSIANETLAANQQRIDLGGGNYDIHTRNDDGSLDVKSVRICFGCHGSRICQACNGVGGKTMSYSGTYYPCGMCGQTGRCKACMGQGTIISFTHTDINGNTHAVSSNGYTAQGGAGGTIVTSPDGKVTGHPSGAGSSSSSSRSSSSQSTKSTDKGICSKCGGRRYESASHQHAAASSSGWMPPYHNSGGNTCPYCNYKTDHYHYPCSECRGYGHN